MGYTNDVWPTSVHFDPGTDFKQVTSLHFVKPCSVLSIASHERRDNHRDNAYDVCYDLYTYTFSMEGKKGNYTSGQDWVTRDGKCDKQKDGVLMISPPTHGWVTFSGDGIVAFERVRVACWEPAQGKRVSELETVYECENKPCIKVNDPRLDFERKYQDEGFYIIMSATFLGASLFFFFPFLCHGFYRLCYQRGAGPALQCSDCIQCGQPVGGVEFCPKCGTANRD